MKPDFFALYEALAAGVTGDAPITALTAGARWSMVETADSLGLGMDTPGSTIAPMFPEGKRLLQHPCAQGGAGDLPAL